MACYDAMIIAYSWDNLQCPSLKNMEIISVERWASMFNKSIYQYQIYPYITFTVTYFVFRPILHGWCHFFQWTVCSLGYDLMNLCFIFHICKIPAHNIISINVLNPTVLFIDKLTYSLVDHYTTHLNWYPLLFSKHNKTKTKNAKRHN